MDQSIITIRDVVSSDIPLIFQWENNPVNWEVSETTKPYTLAEIKALIDSSANFNESQQKRWMIILKDHEEPIGTVDVFQGSLGKGEAGIGILIESKQHRGKGYAGQAINVVVEFASKNLDIHTFHVIVHKNNSPSIRLFEKCGFKMDESKSLKTNFDTSQSQTLNMKLCVKKS